LLIIISGSTPNEKDQNTEPSVVNQIGQELLRRAQQGLVDQQAAHRASGDINEAANDMVAHPTKTWFGENFPIFHTPMSVVQKRGALADSLANQDISVTSTPQSDLILTEILNRRSGLIVQHHVSSCAIHVRHQGYQQLDRTLVDS